MSSACSYVTRFITAMMEVAAYLLVAHHFKMLIKPMKKVMMMMMMVVTARGEEETEAGALTGGEASTLDSERAIRPFS